MAVSPRYTQGLNSGLESPNQGFILTRQQREKQGKTYLEFWLCTPNGRVKLVTSEQQFVLFVKQEDTPRCLSLLQQMDVVYQSNDLTLRTFDQEPICAIYLRRSADLYSLRDHLNLSGIPCFEADIRLADRFLMERFVYGSAAFTGQQRVQGGIQVWQEAKLKPCDYHPDFKVMSLDIECSETGELYSIGMAGADYQEVVMIGKPEPGPAWITWVADESALLKRLIAAFEQYDPDIVVGWSVVNFDFRLLVKRAEKQGIALTLGCDGSPVYWRDSKTDSQQGYISIAGRLVLDGIDGLKTATYQFDSFSLESVAQALLGKGKKVEDVHDRMAEINHDFAHNKVKLAEYNLQDCVLVNEIFQHTQLLDFLILRSQLTGLELDRPGGSVAAFVNLYLPKLHRAGYISPNRPVDGGLASPGGYVMNSFPGLYQHVLVLDFKSLYPSIIRTFKIDPLGLVTGLHQSEDPIPGYRGAQFDREQHFLPDIITHLWQQRDRAKAQKDAARSQAIKILMNSFYGVLGSGGCPFYDTRLASSITMRGHDIMQTTAKWIEEQGHKVIYGDTDSTFVWLEGEHSLESAQYIGQQLARDINQRWQQTLAQTYRLENHLEIEFETYFSRFLMPTIRGSEAGSKKRYAGLKCDANGETLVFKGLENVRSDWTQLAKQLQHELYSRVFNEQPVSEYLKQVVTDTRAGNNDHLLVYRKRLRRPLANYQKNVPPHVKAARFADHHNQRLGRPLQYQKRGTIAYLITTNGPEAQEYRQSPIDHEHYIERQIRPVAEAILGFIDLSFDDIVSDQLGLF